MQVDRALWGGFIYTADIQRTFYNPGAIIYKDGVIIDVGGEKEIREKQYIAKDEINTAGKILLPGFVNCHGHGPLILGRGYGDDLELQPWLEKVTWPLMRQFDEANSYWGALLACYEMVLSGITTFADMWPLPRATGKAAIDSGLRAVIATNIRDLNDPRNIKGELEKLDDLLYWYAGVNCPRINIAVGAHSPYACSKELLAKLLTIAAEKGLGLHIHVAETQKEFIYFYRQLGITPVQYLDSLGMFNLPTVAAHCVWLTEEDIQILGSTEACIAHNPVSNLKLAAGIAPVKRLLDAGVITGLATDSALSGNRLDMLETLKLTTLLQRVREENAAGLTAEEAVRMATIKGAETLGLAKEIGSLEKGKQADIVIIAPSYWAVLDSKESVLSYLVFIATPAEVETVIVAGRLLMHKGQCFTLNRSNLEENVKSSSRALIQELHLGQ